MVGSEGVATARDFFDEDRREALGAKLLVDAEEVDLRDLDRLVADAKVSWDTADCSDELARLGCADADMPLLFPAR